MVGSAADDTAGLDERICYGEGDEDEGLVRGCSCRGTAGFAHVLGAAGEDFSRTLGGKGFGRRMLFERCLQA